jgi:superoxide dismutase, Fe-Mn family
MTTWTRRHILRSAGAVGALLSVAPFSLAADEKEKSKEFTLPKLPYDYDALKPVIGEQTMKFHHDVHHQAYINNANKLLKDHPELLALGARGILSDIEKVPAAIRQGVINNVGGHINHTLFWQLMTPKGGTGPTGDLLEAINSTFKSVDGFKTIFNEKAMTTFGSGWAWLVLTKDGKLEIISRPNQNSPYLEGLRPVMGLDVWEHAYYLDYGPKRADYVKAWWNVVNWDYIGKRFENLSKGKA